jgi:formylglycine-generating enzyme required for sulfatase activity
VFWSRNGDGLMSHTLLDSFALDRVADWPVYVSHAEAEAFCRWRGGRLATEADFHRAANTTPDGGVRDYPWGDDRPTQRHGNLDR